MKVFKLYGKQSSGTFSLHGLKTLFADGFSRNEVQDAMAVIQWLNTMDIIIDYLAWLWDDGTEMQWDDGTPILLDSQ